MSVQILYKIVEIAEDGSLTRIKNGERVEIICPLQGNNSPCNTHCAFFQLGDVDGQPVQLTVALCDYSKTILGNFPVKTNIEPPSPVPIFKPVD